MGGSVSLPTDSVILVYLQEKDFYLGWRISQFEPPQSIFIPSLVKMYKIHCKLWLYKTFHDCYCFRQSMRNTSEGTAVLSVGVYWVSVWTSAMQCPCLQLLLWLHIFCEEPLFFKGKCDMICVITDELIPPCTIVSEYSRQSKISWYNTVESEA
jgi:hypothetical protein